MSFVKHSSARHRAETNSHLVRNSTVAAVAAGAVVAGFASPAQAASGVIDLGTTSSAHTTTSYSTSTSYSVEFSSQSSDLLATGSNVSTQSNHSASGIVGTAYEGIGGAYVWGGTGFKAWDCSGFVQWVYAQNGVQLPRTTWAQFAAGHATSNPQPGDLVSQNGGSHVGIYIGNGQMISALNPSQGTQVHSVNAMQVDGFYSVR